MVGFRPFALALALLALLPASAAANSATQIIVKRDAGLSTAERRDIRTDAQVRLVETLSVPRTELVAAQPGDVNDALRDLQADPDVTYAQLNHRRTTLTDPALEKQWGIRNFAQKLFDDDIDSRGIFDADSDVTEAWAQGMTGAGQTVAIVDSGISDFHPDIDGTRVEKYNFVTGETSPDDGDGHGTHVAGIIGATRGNAHGSAGVAPNADLLVLRALDDDGGGYDSDIAAALDFAGDRGARIVNASLGGEGEAPLIEDAIQDHPNTLFVIAAGNGGDDGIGDDNDVTPTYPCDLGEPNIICVGASDNKDERAEFSNYSDVSVDLFAPGDWIVSTYNNGGYVFLSGTSMAAPHVAGAAALALEANPGLDVAQLKAALMNTAEPKPELSGLSVTGARLNAGILVAHVLGNEDDTDTDGVIDAVDACMNDAQAGPDGCAVPDQDADTVADWYDNCDALQNADQADIDKDDIGDACDSDRDGDTFQNQSDNCPNVANPSQRDRPDGDGQGDACDNDRDNDGVANSSDGCPETYAPGTSNGCVQQSNPPPAPPADRDRDGIADVSDACPGVPAATPNGCPLAQVSGVSAKARKRGKRRSATIRIATSDVATLRVTVERKKGRRWARVTRRTIVTSRNLASLRLSRLKRGTHRVRISISNSAGSGTSVSKTFRVR